jgi:hypothetical protein
MSGDTGAHGSSAEYGDTLDGWLILGAGIHKTKRNSLWLNVQQKGEPSAVSVTEQTRLVNRTRDCILKWGYPRLINE